MRFVKAHGAGNDFVLLPDPDDRLALTSGLVRALCSRHLGVGGDGVIRIAPPRVDDADVFMDYWNADGSVAEMCGNGVRCVAKYLADRGLTAARAAQTGEDVGVVRVDTRGGVKDVTVVERHADGRAARLRVDMGAPAPGKTGLVLHTPRGQVEVTTLSMGNPHAVTVVDDVATAPVATLGPLVERHEAFAEGTNVEFIAVPERDRVVGRIWERGVGETMASGTGASAMAVAAALLGLAERRVAVVLPGGRLDVDWSGDTVLVTGAAVEVAAGELDEAWLAAAAPAQARQGSGW